MPDYDSDFTIDLGRTSGDPIAIGVHLCEVVEVVCKDGKEDPYLSWKMNVNNPQDPDDGKALWHNTSLGAKSKWSRDLWLDAIGAPTEGRMAISNFVGSMVKIRVEHEEYQGKIQARVGSASPAGPAQRVRTDQVAGLATGAAPTTESQQRLPEDPQNTPAEAPKAMGPGRGQPMPF